MLVRLLSDIHLEFSDYVVESMPEDKETTLVLAGDITVVASRVHKNVFVPFIGRCSKQFKRVIMIAGNHEFYHSKFEEVIPKLKASISQFDNVFILDNYWVEFDGVAFIGSVLWTDAGTKESINPKAQYLFHGMTDSKIIKYNDGPFTVECMRKEHLISRQYMVETASKCKALGLKVVLIVHHLVSNKSIHPFYAGQDFNMFFKSDMDLELAEVDVPWIFHGHTHHSLDYMLDEAICSTRVLCNPFGYKGHETEASTRGFNPKLRIEI